MKLDASNVTEKLKGMIECCCENEKTTTLKPVSIHLFIFNEIFKSFLFILNLNDWKKWLDSYFFFVLFTIFI